MDDLRKAERFRVAQEEALARVRANPANPPMTSPLPHSNSSSHPSNPNAIPLQPPSHLFTTNPALALPESDAQAILDTMTADDNFLLRGSEALLQSIADAAVAESQDSSRLFA